MLAVMYESLQKNTEAIQEYLRLLENEESLKELKMLIKGMEIKN